MLCYGKICETDYTCQLAVLVRNGSPFETLTPSKVLFRVSVTDTYIRINGSLRGVSG